MSLISVGRDEFVLGQPLSWTVYDQDRKVLMEAGQVIKTEAQLQSLLASNPLRELSWKSAGDKVATEQLETADKDLETALDNTSDNGFTFADMRLRIGDRIQLQPPASVGSERHIVRLIGYVENASLLVTAPIVNGLRVQVRTGDKIVARIFTSQKAFGFDCIIERVCKIPYDYLHLSFPRVIQGAVIRKSVRIRTQIIASIAREGADDAAERQPGLIVNVSADGALVRTRQPLCEISQVITLSFRVTLHDMDAYLTAKAIVRNIFADEDAKEGAELFKYHHGIQFVDLPANDRMILQSLIYQQMIEQPHSLA